jgi:hypothetical protein
LTVNYSNTGSQTKTVCDSFTWSTNSQTYTTSGTYTTTLTNIAGCDSIVSLNLTVNHSDTGSLTVAACDSYFWPANAQVYTTSGTYTDTLSNAAGCDSVVTLNLTVSLSDTGLQAKTACDSYLWPANSEVYMTSGTYTTTLTNANGCDSVVTLELTINNSPDASVIQDGDSITALAMNVEYQWLDCNAGSTPILGETSQVFVAAQNGSYAVEVKELNCVDTSTCLDITSVGLHNLDHSDKVSVFPNPIQADKLTIQFHQIEQNFTIDLFSESGQLILTFKGSNTRSTDIDLSGLGAGVYTIGITTNEKRWHKRVIKL